MPALRRVSSFSGSQQRERDDGDPVGPAVGVAAGGDDRHVEEVIADLAGEPLQMRDVAVVGGRSKLGLDRQHSAAGAFDDEIDLVLAALEPQVAYARIG